MKILVINGPNINMLGEREPNIYGRATYADLLAAIRDKAASSGIVIECAQSNHEGALVDFIQSARFEYDGIIINPAAYTHTSIAILDALKAVKLPTVEVHISDPDKREAFRCVSYIREACVATIKDRGIEGYIDAIDILIKYITSKKLK